MESVDCDWYIQVSSLFIWVGGMGQVEMKKFQDCDGMHDQNYTFTGRPVDNNTYLVSNFPSACNYVKDIVLYLSYS